jgi:hypothetical protein
MVAEVLRAAMGSCRPLNSHCTVVNAPAMPTDPARYFEFLTHTIILFVRGQGHRNFKTNIHLESAVFFRSSGAGARWHRKWWKLFQNWCVLPCL